MENLPPTHRPIPNALQMGSGAVGQDWSWEDARFSEKSLTFAASKKVEFKIAGK
jgi:hypothetical protein